MLLNVFKISYVNFSIQRYNLPISTDPNISNMVARTHACLSVRAFEPTDVPKEFATSLAPTPKAKKNPTMKPNMRIHKTSEEKGSIIIPAVNK